MSGWPRLFVSPVQISLSYYLKCFRCAQEHNILISDGQDSLVRGTSHDNFLFLFFFTFLKTGFIEVTLETGPWPLSPTLSVRTLLPPLSQNLLLLPKLKSFWVLNQLIHLQFLCNASAETGTYSNHLCLELPRMYWLYRSVLQHLGIPFWHSFSRRRAEQGVYVCGTGDTTIETFQHRSTFPFSLVSLLFLSSFPLTSRVLLFFLWLTFTIHYPEFHTPYCFFSWVLHQFPCWHLFLNFQTCLSLLIKL